MVCIMASEKSHLNCVKSTKNHTIDILALKMDVYGFHSRLLYWQYESSFFMSRYIGSNCCFFPLFLLAWYWS